MITFVLLTISAICKAVMDKLQFHYDKSIFTKFKNEIFWNPKISWKNKWKNGDPKNGEKFFGSSTFLVSLTDGWHLFQHFMIFSMMCAIVTYVTIINMFIDFFLLYFIFTCTFELFFKFMFSKKNI
jgi:hypothetical protein